MKSLGYQSIKHLSSNLTISEAFPLPLCDSIIAEIRFKYFIRSIVFPKSQFPCYLNCYLNSGTK